MAAYTYGGLLGVFLLAFLPTRRDDLGLMWGVPLSMLTVFALSWHQPVPQGIVLIAGAVLLVQAFRRLREHPVKILYVGLAVILVWMISMAVVGTTPEGRPVHITLAWPWHFPIGTAMTFITGHLLGNPRPAQPKPHRQMPVCRRLRPRPRPTSPTRRYARLRPICTNLPIVTLASFGAPQAPLRVAAASASYCGRRLAKVHDGVSAVDHSMLASPEKTAWQRTSTCSTPPSRSS